MVCESRGRRLRAGGENADDDDYGYVDLVNPPERYIKIVCTRGGSTGCVLEGMFAILSRPKVRPITQSVAGGQLIVSEPEGTK